MSATSLISARARLLATLKQAAIREAGKPVKAAPVKTRVRVKKVEPEGDDDESLLLLNARFLVKLTRRVAEGIDDDRVEPREAAAFKGAVTEAARILTEVLERL